LIEITKKEFQQLSEYIKSNYGIRLKEEKMALVSGRLQNVLQQEGFSNFSEYYQHLVSDRSGNAVITLVDRITTNHTFFMREASHFYYFKDNVLPYLASTVREKDLRIWCAACSTGEEAYTLAMVIDEFFGKSKRWWDTKILATDISEQVLETAKKGIYSNEKIAPLPASWKAAYFKPYDHENSVIIDRIKDEVIYRKLNLIDNMFPFKKKLHTIFCRNVMIYFDNETKNKLVEKLYNSLEYGGYLIIGHSESLNREITNFKYVLPSVYRKE